MHNIATIYRFNTPFLDIYKEREILISVIKKIEKSLEIDWITYNKEKILEWNYYKIILILKDDLWVIDFFYFSDLSLLEYHLPVFKLDIYLNNSFLLENDSRKSAVKFLNNIFECFDWLTEKEFLIDLDNTFYYTHGIFKTKIFPNHDFLDIEYIRESFESNEGIVIVEDFIKKFSDDSFELDIEKSEYYYKLYSVFLYFIYLVFLMYQNIEKTNLVQNELKENSQNWIYDWNIELVKQRLSYVEQLHNNTFELYKNKLELFFKMF